VRVKASFHFISLRIEYELTEDSLRSFVSPAFRFYSLGFVRFRERFWFEAPK